MLIFTLAVHVPVVYLLAGRPPPAPSFGSLYESGWFLVYLHLWFLGNLLLHSLAYAICRRFVTPGRPARWSWPPPSNAAIVALSAAQHD
jgi:glucan biosynthesis protein C